MQLRCVPARELGVRLRAPPRGLLHVVGDVPPGPRLAIVGSRAAVRSLRRFVPAIVERAGTLGWSVVSGGALGIDADAHQAALRHDVPQIAVLPGPPGVPYPKDNAELFARIVAGRGALVFPHPPGAPYTRGMFASRNRVIVGLVDRVVVVQASLRSGSLYTAGVARQEGRPLAVLAGTPGAAACIATGAGVLGDRGALPVDVADRLQLWLEGGSGSAPRAAWPDELAVLERALTAAGPRGVTLEDFADPVAATLALARAEAQRLVYEVSPGRYVASVTVRS
jgi:DNA protecting protein DprA